MAFPQDIGVEHASFQPGIDEDCMRRHTHSGSTLCLCKHYANTNHFPFIRLGHTSATYESARLPPPIKPQQTSPSARTTYRTAKRNFRRRRDVNSQPARSKLCHSLSGRQPLVTLTVAQYKPSLLFPALCILFALGTATCPAIGLLLLSDDGDANVACL